METFSNPTPTDLWDIGSQEHTLGGHYTWQAGEKDGVLHHVNNSRKKIIISIIKRLFNEIQSILQIFNLQEQTINIF